MAGLVVVIAQHRRGGDMQGCELAGKHPSLFRKPRVGEVASQQQQLGHVRHLGKELLKGASRRLRTVQIADGGDADDRFVRLPYGCHGGSLAGNDSAIRSSISDSRANLPFSTEASGRRRIIRTPAKAATPEAASNAAPATVRRDRSRDLSHATPAGARARAERARATVVRLFTAASFLLPCISEMGRETGSSSFARLLQMPSQKHSRG